MGDYNVGVSCSHWGVFPMTLRAMVDSQYYLLVDWS